MKKLWNAIKAMTLFEKLWTMYLRHGFGPKLQLIQGSSYEERMLAAIESVNRLLQA